MKRFQIAVFGCGMISKSHFKAIAQLPNAQVAAVAEILPDRAKETGERLGCPWYTDAEELLKEQPQVDACLLCLPTYLHSKYIALCASYGKAVLCEKPFTMTVAQAQNAVDAVARAKVPYMTAQVVRFWTGYREIKQMLDAGELGELYLAYFSRCSERQVWDNTWLYDPENGGGAMYDMMVHDVDYMNYLFGPAKSVYTLASKDDTHCYNNVFANITYESGVKAVAETAFNMHTGFPFSMYAKVMGARAAVELTYCAGYDINQRDGALAQLKIYREGQAPEIRDLEQYDPYAAEIAYFLQCIEEGRAPQVVTIDQSLDVIRTVNAIRQSADTGTVVEICR